ncbi:MAG: GGDEF domain-containing protein [Bradymonadaceae bacterium]|nr:GGDEF domain-containing protein [Lujinxingiaceae bacterium]
MTDDHPYGFDDLAENSESTQIVDSNMLKQARLQHQERNQAYLIVIAGPHVGKMFKVEKEETSVGRSSKADFFVQDVGISRMHARIFSRGADVLVEDLQSANGTYLNGERVAIPQRLQDGDKITLGSTTILKFTYHDKLDENFQQQMFDAALRDGLTKAFNKSYFITQLQTELAFALRHGTVLSLIMFDVDHFKPVNDNFGHLAGDAVLIKLSNLATASLRTEDIFARYGGEEFAIICRGIGSQQAALLADRLRQIVANTPFFYDGRNIAITISLGVAAIPELGARNGDELVAAADAALYDAKHAGRNRVMIAQPQQTR